MMLTFQVRVAANARTMLYGSDAARQDSALELMIGPIEDPNINIHLILRLLEAVLLAIEPRIGQQLPASIPQ